MSSKWRELYDLAGPRSGVTIVDDTRQVGIPDRTWQARADRERWDDFGGGARLLPGATKTPEARRHAALAVLGPRALLSHGTALAVHDLSRWSEPDDRVHVVVPYGGETIAPKLTRCHRSRRLQAEDATVVDGFRVTTAARTILDVAADFGHYRLEGMMLAARQRKLLVAEDLHEQLSRRPTLRGAARFGKALAVLDAGPVDSILEHRTLELIRSHDLPEPVPQYRIRHRGRVVVADFAWPDVGVVLECDGRAFHGDQAFQRDRDRWNLIRAAGHDIVWATWDDVYEGPLDLVSELREALGA